MINLKEDDLSMIIRQELLPVMEKLDKLSSVVQPGELPAVSQIVYLADAAKMLGVHPTTVVRWEKMGFFKRRNQVPNSPIYYLKADIEGFMLGNNN